MQVVARTKNEVAPRCLTAAWGQDMKLLPQQHRLLWGRGSDTGSGSECERERKMRTGMIMRRLPLVAVAAHIHFHFRVAPSGLACCWPGLGWLIPGTVATCSMRATLYYVKLIKIKKYFASFFISFSSAAQAMATRQLRLVAWLGAWPKGIFIKRNAKRRLILK